MMAAPSYVFTIARVAKLLGELEELLQDIAMQMEPEDGCLSVLDLDDVSTVAFTPQHPFGTIKAWMGADSLLDEASAPGQHGDKPPRGA
jgi:hypothetical protein